jgi:ferric-chelate reductase (NADPH)
MNAPLAPARPAGLLEATVQKLFTRSVTVVDIVDFGSAFRLVTLGGAALVDVAWTPGDKVQMQLGGWVQRTYTPIDWNATTGHMRFLAYLHADGPGTQWARGLRTGDAAVVFGPRKSIALAAPRAPVIVFGDETSLGLAAALSGRGAAAVMLEVASVADTLQVLEHLQMADVHLCIRRDDQAHFTELEAHLSALLMEDASPELVLTGQASSIQRVSRFLRETGIGAGKRHSKAYWATGKKGLD